ncbi:MAG: hypothetical protein IJ724_03630 [Muribaculaceae bacterium]|nr:hypothetical protein [Muribaculaceae bacterium]MBR1725732.1 hypothetical protein [Muribaculaceae bacterium]
MIEKIKQLAGYCIDKYAWLLSLVLKFNVVRLDKEKYTRKVVHRFYRDNEDEVYAKALATSLSGVLTDEQKRQQYKSLRWFFGSLVFMMSFITCFPVSIVGIVIACAIDIAFFQACLYMAMQRILLLYGTADDEQSDETKSIQKVVSIESSGLMLGKYPLLQKMKSVVGWLGRQLVKRIGPKYMAKASRAVFIVLRRQGIKWFSIVIAKEKVDMLFNLIVPVTCALIAGAVSVFIFIPMCNRLRKHLIRQSQTPTA